jgi:hypothetical protein
LVVRDADKSTLNLPGFQHGQTREIYNEKMG